MALSKARERLVENLVSSLEERVIPWDKPWNVDYANSFIPPINAVTKTNYNGLNQVILFINILENDYNDNRWMTFKQIKDKGFKLQEGSKGVPIEFFQFKDKSTGKEFDFNALKKMTEEEQKEKIKDLRRINKTYYVFNASRIDGIEPLKVVKVDKDKQINEINEKVKNVISNMDLNEFKESGVSAYYNYLNDTVNVPPKSLFKDEIYFNGTILHELAHATLHEKRLDRPEGKSGKFGSDAYALEELRAEISSLFVSNELGMKLEVQHEKNNTGYIQNWLNVLKGEPEIFFDAIKDANKISDFLIDKSKDRNLEYVFANSLNNNELKKDVITKTEQQIVNEKVVIKNMEYSMSNLNVFEIDKFVTEIGNNSYSLNEISVVDLRECHYLEKIGYGSFEDSYIEDVYLNDELKYVEDKCFKDNNIKNIMFGTCLLYVGAEAFGDNKNLKTIEFLGMTPPVLANNAFIHDRLERIIVPQESVDKYKESLNTSNFLMMCKEKDIDKLIIGKEDYEISQSISQQHITDELDMNESMSLAM